MTKGQTIILAFCLQCLTTLAQDDIQFGILSSIDRNLQVYEKDTTASAVYLYEKGDNYFELRDGFIWLITKYHARIKILDKSGTSFSNIEIPYYHSEKNTEEVSKIRAITHNGSTINSVAKEEIFEVNINTNWSEKRFTFPNVKKGSVLEYMYEVKSPFHFNLTGWEFQRSIPKIYSEYNAKIPGNWVYNRSLIGTIKLDIDEVQIEKSCFSVPGNSSSADCEVLRYAIHDIPSFKETEQFMLSARNYRSKLEFELAEYTSFYGGKEQFTKSWKDVDSEFRSDKDIGRQLGKKGFFEKNVPSDLLEEGEPIDRAKNIYRFVQNHFTWNEKYSLWKQNKVKTAFDEKVGSVAEINITLINLLNSAGIKANMMLMATRNRGLPKMNYPVISDFNYVIAKVDIDGESYLLDATDKTIPFGMLPFRCLNYIGRVMDFKNDSYWFDIVPEQRNSTNVRMQLEIDEDNNSLRGVLSQINSGYFSVFKKEELAASSQDKYLEKLENDLIDDGSIESYSLLEESSMDKKVVERIQFEIDQNTIGQNIYVNPFVLKFFSESPFLAETRNYPVDFGYPRNYTLTMNLKIPEEYELKSLPENLSYDLPDNKGSLRLESKENHGGSLLLRFDLRIKLSQYPSHQYKQIKTLFSKALQVQTQTLIVLRKI